MDATPVRAARDVKNLPNVAEPYYADAFRLHPSSNFHRRADRRSSSMAGMASRLSPAAGTERDRHVSAA